MLVERPKVRAIVEAAVEEIEAAGVKASVADILWLAHLAERNCQPNRADPMDDFHVPVRCGRAKRRAPRGARGLKQRRCRVGMAS